MMRDAHPNGKSENNLQFDRKEEATVPVKSLGRLFGLTARRDLSYFPCRNPSWSIHSRITRADSRSKRT